MTASTGKTTRVIGWYHSHPHITVLPSHVDVRTQATYQLLDSGFIGLIFSCFSEDTNKKFNYDLESSLSSSKNALMTSGSAKVDSPLQDTGDSRTIEGSSRGGGRSVDLGGFFTNADANYLGMQEAMHRSNLDISGAEYVRKEIPLHVLPTSSVLNLDSPLMSFTDLQHVLYEEELAAYNQAILHNMRDGKVHPLSFIHHTSTFQASMCKLIEYCLSPAINALQDRLKENEIWLAMLTDEAKTLETEAFKGSGPSSLHHASSHGFRGSALVGQRDFCIIQLSSSI
ncbi:hypothetical protein CRYUN_Cryun37aG0035000 [Craigia yunnanensis]